ncbi:unnamed protein product [Amoebophrya sp. A25]|nr:unnamed protein product [Amoebophrya sp. A25]|eukprot:GSA25T00005934001.1
MYGSMHSPQGATAPHTSIDLRQVAQFEVARVERAFLRERARQIWDTNKTSFYWPYVDQVHFGRTYANAPRCLDPRLRSTGYEYAKTRPEMGYTLTPRENSLHAKRSQSRSKQGLSRSVSEIFDSQTLLMRTEETVPDLRPIGTPRKKLEQLVEKRFADQHERKRQRSRAAAGLDIESDTIGAGQRESCAESSVPLSRSSSRDAPHHTGSVDPSDFLAAGSRATSKGEVPTGNSLDHASNGLLQPHHVSFGDTLDSMQPFTTTSCILPSTSSGRSSGNGRSNRPRRSSSHTPKDNKRPQTADRSASASPKSRNPSGGFAHTREQREKRPDTAPCHSRPLQWHENHGQTVSPSRVGCRCYGQYSQDPRVVHDRPLNINMIEELWDD